ncbi:MerR family transcriptional regulator [Kytococcus sedentarius]|uniref:MerR family transcriptional regulator n=1 Tax=Kytococcus sedentarius TaxID=1276 RepID=UPI00194ECC48|nr:MerR family transcriptional regulator [Kytococcus sedentarius]QRO87503.1 MerR family transcriptional regulator [Kytococcus sedentarius]
MTDSPDPMSIGQFSSLTRLSVRMLRHYDQHGVLTPAQVDAANGYRFYASDQLADAADVRRLRDVGFGVSAIAALLATRGTPAWERALLLQRQTLTADLLAAQQRVALIDRMLQTKEKTMSIEINETTLPATILVLLRGTIPSYSSEGVLWERFIPELGRQGLTPIGPGGVVENDPTYVEEGPDVSVWLPVAPGSTAESPLEVHELPQQRAVKATITGPYSQISEAHAQMAEYMRQEGLSEAQPGDGPVGKVVNRYLSDPTNTPEADLLTEVYRPLA